MFTAISSLNLHQYFMDVVADNLANANTPSFKSSRVSFQDQFAQTLWNGAAPSQNLGGINPAQIGLGARLGAISQNFSQGMLQSTGRDTDLAIQGDGFFIYNNGPAQYYSRDGVLEIDADGFLVNAGTGMRLQGWQATTSGSTATVNTGGPLGGIQLPLGSSLARATTRFSLAGNLDSSTVSGSAGSYAVSAGVYDSLGVLHSVPMTFTKTGDNAWSWDAGASGSGALTFNANGALASATGSISIPGSGGASAINISPDFSALTQLGTANDVSVSTQDGLAAGSFTGFYVATQTGEIYGVYSNGMQQLLGQVAMANFVNPSGLTRMGQNIYSVGPNSGNPAIGAPNTGGRGTVASGYVEGSNVDLGQEFTNMILAQRGFQASSRIITTSDEMLQELVNIKR
jgi:flagellar hook protein FlgE